MNRISLLFIGLFVTASLTGQNFIRIAPVAPEIDGYWDDVWETAEAYPIEKPFKTENPTVTATWYALHDWEYFYVFILVEDDNHWPGWEAGGDSWLYDKPEIYWDVNKQVYDGKGAKDIGYGHYQFAEGFAKGMYDTAITKVPEGSNPGGVFAYSLIGEGYSYELAVPFANLKNTLGEEALKYTNNFIGFDVSVIDQDEGITTARQRCVWSNDGNGNNGSSDESWNNMDGAGRIILGFHFEPPYFQISDDSITLSSKPAGDKIISVLSTEIWSVVSDQSWLTISQITSESLKSFKISASENTGKTRIAKVTITCQECCEGYKQQYITVTQLGSGDVGISVVNIKQLQLYPNPTMDKITIQGGIDRVELFNSLGVLVKETAVEGKTVSVTELPNGLYMVKAYKKGQFEGVAKIVKN